MYKYTLDYICTPLIAVAVASINRTLTASLEIIEK